MKKLLLVAAMGLTGLMGSSAQAASTSGTFNVTITLTSSCTLGAITAVDFAYASLGPLVNGTGGGFSVSCTNGLPYTFGLQTGNGAPIVPGAATINVTDSAVNLAYQLALSAAGGTGSGVVQNYSVTGTMAAGQSGTCGTAVCTNAASANAVQTLIVNY